MAKVVDADNVILALTSVNTSDGSEGEVLLFPASAIQQLERSTSSNPTYFRVKAAVVVRGVGFPVTATVEQIAAAMGATVVSVP